MKFKGRQLGFLMLLCSGWALARVVMLSSPATVVPSATIVAVSPDTKRQAIPPQQASYVTEAALPTAPNLAEENKPHPRMGLPIAFQPKQQLYAQSDHSAPTRLPLSPSLQKTQPRIQQASINPALTTVPLSRKPVAEIYAYSFWRWDSQGSALAAGGQYGGSQSGLIVAIPLRSIGLLGTGDDLAMLFRAVVTPDGAADREVAVGVRWRPVRNLPITITAERRFRPVGPDRSAVYIAGGVDSVALPARFDLDGYAQSGVVSGRGAGRFFDASAHAYRRVAKAGAFSAKAGAGAWAGGQRGAARLDIGPSLSADVSIGSARFRLNADWRFRVAGNAQPGNGPALTLSTSF